MEDRVEIEREIERKIGHRYRWKYRYDKDITYKEHLSIMLYLCTSCKSIHHLSQIKGKEYTKAIV